MSKGIENIIIAVILVIIVVVSTTAFLVWTQDIGQRFKETAETQSETQAQKSRTSFTIVNAAGDEVGVKNTGEVSIKMNELAFFLNGTRADYFSTTPPSAPGDSIDPGRLYVFRLNLGAFPPGTFVYLVRVTGPYGISDELTAQMTIP